VESSKEQSTLSYITNEGESAFIQVNGTDLRFRDLKVFPTNRPEDTQMFNELRQLAQAVIQNGGTLYDVIELYSTKSMRQMKKTFKDLRDRIWKQQEDAQKLEQQKLEQAQQIAQAQIEEAARQKQEEMANDNYQKELDRINKKEIAIIQATGFGNVESEDVNQNMVPDVMEVSKLAAEESRAAKDYQLKMADIQSKSSQALQKMELEKEKLKVERENMKNDLQIAKVNASNRKSVKKK